MDRRTFLKASTLGGLATSAASRWLPASANDDVPPARPMTSPPGYHWFGYYDKQQVDPIGRYALGMEVDFRFRSPRATDVLDIGLIDLEQGNSWKKVGESRAWSWQQGCMLQWIPGSTEKILWNDRDGDRFVSRVLNVHTGEQRTLPRPIYALSPDGRFAVGTEYRRVQNMRPGYGYPGLEDPDRNVRAPEEVGIYRMDLQTGEHELIVPLSEVTERPHQGEARMQTLYLYHVPTDRKVILARFPSPPRYEGEWRCDLHPRSNQDGTMVIFDSTHEGNSRQMYAIDISDVVTT